MELEYQKYMRIALEEARKAFLEGEVPVGAVFVYKGEVIARAYNRVEQAQDASAHAELLCLKAAAQVLGNWRLMDGVLYSTLEPCTMCLGSMWLFRLGGLVYGAKDIRHGALGSWVDLSKSDHPMHAFPIVSGVCEEESRELLRSFFQLQRKKERC